MPPPKKHQRREANLGALIEKLESLQEQLGDKGPFHHISACHKIQIGLNLVLRRKEERGGGGD